MDRRVCGYCTHLVIEWMDARCGCESSWKYGEHVYSDDEACECYWENDDLAN